MHRIVLVHGVEIDVEPVFEWFTILVAQPLTVVVHEGPLVGDGELAGLRDGCESAWFSCPSIPQRRAAHPFRNVLAAGVSET